MPAPAFLRNETAEIQIATHPDRLIMIIPGLPGNRARSIANGAVRQARVLCPKLTGFSARRLYPLYGNGYFGIGFPDYILWYQEQGTRAHTMWSLQGKTIPMWLDDPYGTLRQENPKAQTRTTASGRNQVLIFRRATQPGAPGRIGRREAGRPWTTPGRTGGRIARGNIGVKWRHPGLAPRLFMNRSLTQAAQQGGILPVRVYAADSTWRNTYGHLLEQAAT